MGLHPIFGVSPDSALSNNSVDERKLKDALIGDFTEVTVAAGDSFLLGDVGDSGNSRRDTIQGILDLVTLPSPDFTSTDQTVTADTLLDVAHSLSAVPTLFTVTLKCTTDEHGYVANDEILPPPKAGADTGITSHSDGTNITIVQGLSIPVHVQSTFNDSNITTTSWRWVVRCWK